MPENMYVAAQTMLFLQSILVGIAIGIIYEPFRLMRAMISAGTVFVFIQDILYFLIAGFITFSFMLDAETGKIRFALILGEIIGAALYLLTMGELINRVLVWVVKLVRRILNWIFRKILYPVLRLAFAPVVFAAKKVKKFFENTKIHLKTRVKVVYNHCISISKRNAEKRKRTKVWGQMQRKR